MRILLADDHAVVRRGLEMVLMGMRDEDQIRLDQAGPGGDGTLGTAGRIDEHHPAALPREPHIVVVQVDDTLEQLAARLRCVEYRLGACQTTLPLL